MHDAERLSILVRRFVGRVKTMQHAGHEGDRDVHVDPLSALRTRAQQLRESFTVDVIHDEKHVAILFDDIEHRGDVGMSNPSGQTRFVQEHGREFCVARQVRMQMLYRDEARKAPRAQQSTQVDRTHAARGDHRTQFVSPEYVRGRRSVWLSHRQGHLSPPGWRIADSNGSRLSL